MIAIIARGLPGSGKSTKSKQLAQAHNAVICSADFYWNDKPFNANELGQAHKSCQTAFVNALDSGKNALVDNTNTTYSEFSFYIEEALKRNCEVYFAYPETDWRYDVDECAKKTIHNVPIETIQKMKDRFISHDDLSKMVWERHLIEPKQL